MDRTRTYLLALLLAVFGTPVAAQPRWDLAPLAGLFTGRSTAPVPGGYQDDWFETAQGGVLLGRHLSPNLKTHVEVAGTVEAGRFVTTTVAVPGVPAPYWITSEERASVRSAAATLAWQFRDNEWIHPFVEAGLSIDRDRRVLVTPEQFFFGDPRTTTGPRRITEAASVEIVTWHARPLLGAGAKLYFRERAFVRTDARLTFDHDRQHVAFRVGVGVDF